MNIEPPQIPAALARKLGHYVYVYVDPTDDRVFYVGKGQRARALVSLDDATKKRVAEIVCEIRTAGHEPRIEILAHDLPSAEVALQVESAAIDLLGLDNLANAMRGWRSAKFGRMPLRELSAHYLRQRVRIVEPAILIRITQLYRYGMSAAELYDVTRSAWKVGPIREQATLALAVVEGVVREVYAINSWLRAGSTFNFRWGGRAKAYSDRWEFVGTLASDDVRRRYVHGYVGDLFPKGARNPIAYVNIK